MTNLVLYILCSIIFAFLGYLLGKYIAQLQQKNQAQTLDTKAQLLTKEIALLQQKITQNQQEFTKTLQEEKQEKEALRREKEFFQVELTQKNTQYSHLNLQYKEQKEQLSGMQDQFKKDFELLASKILEEKSEKFTHQNKQNIQHILAPLQEKIQLFEKKVEQTHKESIDYHAALRQQIIGLKETNLQMSRETLNLTKALKGDNKMQGNWGELVLERVLEKSGLEKDREYKVQQNFTKQDGSRVLPDVIIYLPDNKKMIIDAKVSLVAYEKYVNTENSLEKQSYLKEHIKSIENHVTQLSAKKYEDLYDIESPNFVLLFIPIEPAFASALQIEPNLYNKAFDKNIVIVTPTTLLATLRTIDSMWHTEKQQRNALEIARQAGALYDKFEGLVTDLKNVGKKIEDSNTHYQNAMNKLTQGRGNIVVSIEKLKKMGAKAKKALPQDMVENALEQQQITSKNQNS